MLTILGIGNQRIGTPFSNENSIEGNGTSNYASAGHIADVTFLRTDAFMVSFWGKITGGAYGSGGAGNDVIIGQNASGNETPGWNIQHQGDTTNVYMEITDDGPGQIWSQKETGWPDDTWIHFQVAYSGNSDVSGIKFYINGVLQSGLTTGGTGGPLTGSTATTAHLQLLAKGSHGVSVARHFPGKIDKPIIFSGSWSDAEATELYASGNPDYDYTTHSRYASSCLHYWPAGEGTDSTSLIEDVKGSADFTLGSWTISSDVPP